MSEILSQMYTGLHVKYPLFVSDLSQTCIFSTDFPKNTNIINFMKMCSVGVELFLADGQTDGRR